MKRLLFIVNLLVLFVFLTITNVYAKECTTEELRELKSLAKKVEIGYSPQKSELGDYAFFVQAYNLNKNFYLNVDNYKYVFYMSQNAEIGMYTPGSTIHISIFASNLSNCNGELLLTQKISLPYYNKYSDSNECVGKEKNEVCKKWYDTSKISEEKFKELISEKQSKEDRKNIFNSVISILKQYGLIGLGIIVVVGLFVFAVIFIRNKKRTKIDL